MKTSDFYYELPEELIAQTPIEPRDSSRLMTLSRTDGRIGHHVFREIADMLNPPATVLCSMIRACFRRVFSA